jgi:hypothetical protein
LIFSGYGAKCQRIIEGVVLSAHSSMLHGTHNIPMAVKQWALKLNSCQVPLYSNPLENPVNFIKKKHLRNLINLELSLSLFILNLL